MGMFAYTLLWISCSLTFQLSRGGVRSIVQLTILQELEKQIGLGVNIVDFFDLIIGPRYFAHPLMWSWCKFVLRISHSGGGIVAAGLGIGKHSTAECLEKFRKISKDAFVKRAGIGTIFGPLVEAQNHSRYKTKNLDRALQKAFGEKSILFGGQRDSTCEPTIRVGVSTTTSTGRAFLLANYQRCTPTDCMFTKIPSTTAAGRKNREMWKLDVRNTDAQLARAHRTLQSKPQKHDPCFPIFSYQRLY